MKIGLKLILIIGTVAIISIALTGTVYYFIAQQSIEKRVEAQLETAAILKENNINDFIKERANEIEAVAKEKALISNYIGLLEANDSQETVMLYNANIKQLLNERIVNKENFFELFILNLNGKIILSTDESQDGKFKSSEEYFIKGKKEIYFQNFYYDIDLRQPVMTIAMPIKDNKGKILGVLAGKLNLNKISNVMIERSGLGETGETYLVNKFNLLASKSRFIQGIEFKEVIRTEGVRNCLKKNNSYGNYANYRNIPVIGLYRWLPSREICLLAEIEQQEAFKPVKELRDIIIASCFGIIILAIILGLILARKITVPIHKLHKGAEKIAKGELGFKLDIKTGDEIEQLADEFNLMSGKLEKSYAALKEESKKRIEQLINDKAKSEAILAGIGEGLVAVDKEGNILFVNKVFEALTGWSEKEVMGKRMIEVITQEDEAGNIVPLQERALTQVLTGTASAIAIHNTDFYYIRKDQIGFLAASVITPMIINKKIVGAVEVFRDITEEKKAERMRMDFLVLASHQLRAPLSNIKWLIETMYKGIAGKMTKKQKEYLNDIYKTNEQMIQIIADILSTLRLEHERLPAKKEKILVISFFEDILTAVSAEAKKQEIELRIPLNDKTFIIETDLKILKTIIETFLSNAINYSMPGQKVILNFKEEPEEIIFSVCDFGIGIPQDEQGRIFERFYRASNAKKLKLTGTGLNLSSAKLLARKINAKISFESEEGKGSVFYLKIPKMAK